MNDRVKPALTRHSSGARGGRGEPGPRNGPESTRAVALIGGRRVRVALDVPIDARIRAIAAGQRGRSSRDQLLTAGVKPGAIKRRLRSGRLERVHRGVYGLPNTADLEHAAEAGAVLACGEKAVLSHHSAATVWQLRPGIARPVHVTLLGERGVPKLTGAVVHRSRTLAPADIAVHHGLPVTAPARTLLDVAATLADRDVERLLDEALFVRRLLTLAEVDDVLARAGGHSGRARLARAARNHTKSTETDSAPEERLLALMRAAALPEPDLRTYILGYRLDFFWPSLNLAVEVDAYGTHGSPARFESDRQRDARLLAQAGIIVVRVTRIAIEERPLEVIAVLARAIARQEAQLAPGR